MSVNPELRRLDIDIPSQPQSLVQLSLLLAEDDINLQAVATLIDPLQAALARLGDHSQALGAQLQAGQESFHRQALATRLGEEDRALRALADLAPQAQAGHAPARSRFGAHRPRGVRSRPRPRDV